LDDAAVAARAALEMFKQKGDVASVRTTRAVLRRLEAEGAELADVTAP
jgi:hypothetical protein